MEENTLIQFTNVYNVLDKFIKDLAETYKSSLIRDGKKATGNLIKSIKPMPIEIISSKYVASISVADYWKWVENGRKAGGKFPPPGVILKWIEDKPILPRPINGITPSKNQLSYLIGRKIAEKGIKPGNQLNNTLNNVYQRYEKLFADAIEADISNSLTVINRVLTKY